jgi:hypothetical protein
VTDHEAQRSTFAFPLRPGSPTPLADVEDPGIMSPQAITPEQQRPAFMATLGLLPPYTREDIQAAYHEKARITHPDHGGSVSDFEKLHEAYEQALEYAKFHLDRRQWLAARVERYAAQEKIVNEVHRLGGATEIEQIDWMKRSFGDFAVVTEMLRGIRLRGQANGDTFLKYLAENASALGFLLWLDLSGSQVSDRGLGELQALKSLRRLDLSGTPVSASELGFVAGLPDLEWLNLASTAIGWWARWRLRRSFPGLQVVTVSVA